MVKRSKSSRKPQAKQTAAANAVELLKAEHEEVAALFETFESADTAEREVLAGQICEKLTVHARIEEEILYPAARDVLEEEDEDLVNEAAVELGTETEGAPEERKERGAA